MLGSGPLETSTPPSTQTSKSSWTLQRWIEIGLVDLDDLAVAFSYPVRTCWI